MIITAEYNGIDFTDDRDRNGENWLINYSNQRVVNKLTLDTEQCLLFEFTEDVFSEPTISFFGSKASKTEPLFLVEGTTNVYMSSFVVDSDFGVGVFKVSDGGSQIAYSEMSEVVQRTDELAIVTGQNRNNKNGIMGASPFLLTLDYSRWKGKKYFVDKQEHELSFGRKIKINSESNIFRRFTFLNLSQNQANVLKWLSDMRDFSINNEYLSCVSEWTEVAQDESELIDLTADFARVDQSFFAKTTKTVPTPFVYPIVNGETATDKSDYDLWQEGFKTNWDNAIAEAPLANSQRPLHVYYACESLVYPAWVNKDVVVFNAETGAYRISSTDSAGVLNFLNTDFFINKYDGMEYVCVIFNAESFTATPIFRTQLPILYSNTTTVTTNEFYLFLIWDYNYRSYYPYLRGLDARHISGTVSIFETIEKITYKTIATTVELLHITGTSLQAKCLKELVDSAKSTTWTISTWGRYVTLRITIPDLAHWFYNEFLYTYLGYYANQAAYQMSGIVNTLFINENLLLTRNGEGYAINIPNCVHLNGLLNESQVSRADQGRHGFKGGNQLQDFPMWKVLDGASTGCLMPILAPAPGSNGSFIFNSPNMNRKKFCEFDELGEIIEDPTKYFVCNLPIQTVSGATVQFTVTTWKNRFTPTERDKIATYLTAKNWNLTW